jgi:hypothetical protein
MKTVVLCGSEHSGTTLLLDMLRGHPRIFGPFEIGLLHAGSLGRPDLVRWCQSHPTQASVLSRGYDLDALTLCRMAERSGGWMSFYADILDHMLRTEGRWGRDILVDKFPLYASHLLSHVYPKMQAVETLVVVRDPRAVYCSWLKRDYRKPDLGDFITRYAAAMQTAMAALDKPVLLVRFEELVLKPAETMQDVARFIGVDYDTDMEDPVHSYDQHEKTKFHYPHFNAGRRRRESLDRTAVDEWAQVLGPGVADAVVAALPDDLAWTLYENEEAPCRA